MTIYSRKTPYARYLGEIAVARKSIRATEATPSPTRQVPSPLAYEFSNSDPDVNHLAPQRISAFRIPPQKDCIFKKLGRRWSLSFDPPAWHRPENEHSRFVSVLSPHLRPEN